MLSLEKDEDFSIKLEEIQQARKRKLIINMLTVFGDESSDEKQHRVFSVAGVIGQKEEWDTLEICWLNRTGGKPFHAADCEAGRDDYRGMSRNERLGLYADLVKIIVRSRLISYTVTMDLMAFNMFLPDSIDHAPYLICFREVVIRFAKVASMFIPPENIKFVFDADLKTRASAASLYDYMAQSSEWKCGQYMEDEMGFACRKTVGIQVADIIARESMKHYDNFFAAHLASEDHQRMPVRQSMELLLSSKRHWFKYLDNEFFEKVKRDPRLSEENDPFKADDYLAWISQTRRNDTLSNKVAFLLRQ